MEIFAQYKRLLGGSVQEIKQDDFVAFFDFLDDPDPVVRTTVAKFFGNCYAQTHDLESDWFDCRTEMSLVSMMQIISAKHIKHGYVAGGFIDGLAGELDGLNGVVEEIKEIDKVADFDLRAWVLNICTNADEEEKYYPVAQAWWFYVHEYFDCDSDAVLQMIDAGKYFLATECALESLPHSLPGMQPAIDRLLGEAPQELQDRIQKKISYL